MKNPFTLLKNFFGVKRQGKVRPTETPITKIIPSDTSLPKQKHEVLPESMKKIRLEAELQRRIIAQQQIDRRKGLHTFHIENKSTGQIIAIKARDRKNAYRKFNNKVKSNTLCGAMIQS